MADPIPASSREASIPSSTTTSVESRRRKSYIQGLLLLLVVVILWTASNFLTNALLTTGGYDKPFFVTFANTSSFALYLTPYLVSKRLRKRWIDAESKHQAKKGKYSPLAEDAERANEESDRDHGLPASSDKIPKWLKTLGFDVPTTPTTTQLGILVPPIIADRDPLTSTSTALKPFAALAEQQRGRRNSNNARNHDGDTTPLLANSRAVSPVRPFLVSTTVPRPSSIDGRRPRSEIVLSVPPQAVATTSSIAGAEALPVTLPLPPLTFRQTAVLASQFTLVWFGANWAINAGLGLTSVASGTTIGSASGFFTLALGALLGVDRFTLPRLGAVCISAFGVFAVTYADSGAAANVTGATTDAVTQSAGVVLNELWKREFQPSAAGDDAFVGTLFAGKPPNAPMGDLLALLSAFLYSLYVMLLKTRIGSEDRISMPLMFGIVGAINILCLWPFLPILHFTGIEPFELPPNPRVWAAVIVNMAITFVSDFIYLLAMLKSSPLITTLGLSLTIPLAVVIDALKGSHSGGNLAALGSTLVLSSFAFIGFDDHRTFKQEKRRQQQQALLDVQGLQHQQQQTFTRSQRVEESSSSSAKPASVLSSHSRLTLDDADARS